jgi:putative N6-adenine-specific DNA methylase
MTEHDDLGQLFATAARGCEPALRDELRELRFRGVRADRGGVHFAGDLAEAARACLWSRIAVRVLVRIAEIEAPDGGALYDGIRSIDWSPWISPRHTLAIGATSRGSALTHTQFVAQRAKDGIVDQLRDRTGARPSVDLADPDVRIFLHLVRDRATVYLDASGESLHRRGWRTRIGEAPLKETLAATIVRLSGWDRRTPFVDPMCGSGTIAIEADQAAREIAPGLQIGRFGVERWPTHDEAAARRLAAMRTEAEARIRPDGPVIVARDVDPAILEVARANARGAGAKLVIEEGSVADLRPSDGPGAFATNPPYGERLAGDERLYRTLGEAIARRPNQTAAVLAGAPSIKHALDRVLGRRRQQATALWNGPLECRLLVYQRVSERG